jgi:hypothetical protein
MVTIEQIREAEQMFTIARHNFNWADPSNQKLIDATIHDLNGAQSRLGALIDEYRQEVAA